MHWSPILILCWGGEGTHSCPFWHRIHLGRTLNQQWVLIAKNTKVLSASFFSPTAKTHLGAAQTQILCLLIHTLWLCNGYKANILSLLVFTYYTPKTCITRFEIYVWASSIFFSIIHPFKKMDF